MTEKQVELSTQIRTMMEKTAKLQLEYWKLIADLSSWHFWIVILMLLLPLIVLFFYIDKRNALLLGFFGLNFHIWFAYANKILIGLGLIEYPYPVFPFIDSFSLDASFVPIAFMLLYQWTIKHNKNIYLYSILLSAILAFVFKPILVNLDLFHMFKGVNYFHLFLFYMAFFIASKLITNLFLWLQRGK
ncbi:hypothetical protein EU245_11980 [Lentibacillus lipolyticus]|nr:hypothetical protein EU245_11980 [Lentibacillus lipolyticus]